MSQQGPSPSTPSQTAASRNHGAASPSLNNFVFLDEVDIGEQVKIQARLSRTLESAYDLAINEALRRSLLDCPDDQSLEIDGTVGGVADPALNQPPVSPPPPADTDADTDMNRALLPAGDIMGDDDCLLERGATAAVSPSVRVQHHSASPSAGLTSPFPGMLSAQDYEPDVQSNGFPDICALDLNDADADDEDDDVPRSRRGRHERQKEGLSERRSSLGGMSEALTEDAPGADFTNSCQSERRPSLDRASQYRSERRPSLEMRDSHRSERRPSLERLNNNGGRSERRPSLEKLNDRRSERRPSLDMIERVQSVKDRESYERERRPSLDRRESYDRERRPSLDRRDNRERRPSLDRRDNTERRPSLDRRDNTERRPSLDRRDNTERRPSLERRDNTERRPSLERADNRERRDSLGRLTKAGEGGGESPSPADSASTRPEQGINTLRPWPLNEAGLPTNWDVTQLPQGSNILYCLVSLSPMDREYSAITVDFEEAGLKVVSVERLQNTMLLERFNHEKEHLLKLRPPGEMGDACLFCFFCHLLKLRPPDFELNERYLYHGTQANKHCLSEEGLDHRLSFQGCFGRGIYFSDNPRKCMQYATSTSNSLHSRGTSPMMLVCRVLLGESKVYDHGIKNSNLKREPEKPRAKGGWKYYDSVQGIPVDYPEFVVYDNRRSMIEYIVTFEEVAYRAPPAVSNFYQTPAPSLYKVEPITLPIPEDELDRMYMLCPDTDSDGSCDEHTREVEHLRDNVKRAKAQRLGIPYRPPTKEEKRYERLHWKRVCYYSCPPASPLFEMMIMKKTQEKADRKKRKAAAKAKKAAEEGKEAGAEDEALGAVGGSGSVPVSVGTTTTSSTAKPATTAAATGAESAEPNYEVENDSVAEVLSTLIAEFLTVTSMDNVAKARRYLLENSMDLDQALCSFFRDLE
ncbi:hypothetical protein ACOMHN_025302 [Nucella lapillus]